MFVGLERENVHKRTKVHQQEQKENSKVIYC